MARLALGTLAIALALTAAPPAAAQDGQRWPGRTITYHESPKDLGVRDAAKAWNRSGVRVRFKRVSSSSRADVRVRIVGRGCAGFAQLGYAPGRQAQMQVGRCARYTQTQVSAHEFGHILGLGHETRRCALMNPVLFNGAGENCEPPGQDLYRCRLLEPHDLRRAARKYGGRPKATQPVNCPLYPAPPGPAGFEVGAGDPYSIQVKLTLPAKPAPVVRVGYDFGPQATVQIARAAGACPADVGPLFATPAQESFPGWGQVEEHFLEALQGPQCVAARIVDSLGRAGPASATTVTPPAPPPEEEPPPEESEEPPPEE